MKYLIAILLALQATAFAATDPFTLAFYRFENNANDATTNNYTLTNSNGVPFVSTPTPPKGLFWAGTYNVSNRQFIAPNGLMLDMEGEAEITIEFYIYFNSIGNGPLPLSLQTSFGDYAFQTFSDGKVRLVVANNFVDSAPGTVTSGVLYYVAMVLKAGGGNSKLFFSPAASISQTALLTSGSVSGPPADIFTMRIGAYYASGAFQLDGYIDDLRISNVVRTVFPTVDPGFSETVRAPSFLKVDPGQIIKDPNPVRVP